MPGLKTLYRQLNPLGAQSTKPLSNHETPQINSLTGLRFYAAFAVFLSHLYHFQYFGIQSQEIILVLSYLGHLGVSIFYVLSGFILLNRYFEPTKALKLKDFYIARLARIYPVFLLLTCVAIPMELFSARKHEFWINLLQNITLSQCATANACGSFNDVGWSLSVEAFFYIAFPMLLLALYKPQQLKWIVFGAILYYTLIWNILPTSFYTSHRFPLNRLAEFFAGMVAGKLFLNQKQISTVKPAFYEKNAGLWMALCGGFLVILPLLLAPFHWLDKDYLFAIIPSCLLIFLLAHQENRKKTSRWLTSAIVVLGGEISYSFYLVHNLLIRYAEHALKILFQIELPKLPIGLQILSASLWLVSALLLAAWLYHAIEKPFRQKVKRWFSPPLLNPKPIQSVDPP